MTRRDTLQAVHEPFGDAYYFGPERIAERYEDDEKARLESGYADSTYKTIFDRIARDNSEVGSLPALILAFLYTISFRVCCLMSFTSNQDFLIHPRSYSSLAIHTCTLPTT